MAGHDASGELMDRVREASVRRSPLRIVGGNTKCFLGPQVRGDALDVSSHRGIVSYDPAELVITARGGTPLSEVEATLESRGQRLAFEPPSFGDAATLGGTVACGLCGPARACAGPLRDHLLGVRILTGDGRVLRFGGEVVKNVAGYDVARTMAGAFGTLGILLDVSLKLRPLPTATRSLSLALDQAQAIAELMRLARTSLPLTASCWTGGALTLRFEGSRRTLDAVQQRIGGTVVEEDAAFWRSIREHSHGFFAANAALWRLTVPAAAPPLPLPGDPLIEWNGLQRWYALDPALDAFRTASVAGGFATAFRRASPGDPAFAPPPAPLLDLHRSLKRIFDPAGILNPGRMYPDL